MIIFTPIFEKDISEKQTIPKFDGIRMTLDEFQNWNPEIEAGIKYEWNNGVVEAEEKMKFNEQKIVYKLQHHFLKTSAHKNGNSLFSEVECFLKQINKVRIPDICFLTKDQIQNCNNPETSQVPYFVIEIISPSNSSFEVEQKIRDYFHSGVKVIWCIFPNHKEIKIYKSIKDIKVCLEDDICDVGDIIPDFQITVNEIFQS